MTPEEAIQFAEAAEKRGVPAKVIAMALDLTGLVKLAEEVERLRELMAEVAEHPACPHSCREDLLDALREPMQRVGEQKRSPRELLRMPKEKRSRILRTAAAKAESDYRRNRDLTDYEANGSE